MTETKAAVKARQLNNIEMGAWRSFIETYSELIRSIEADLTRVGISLGDYQVLVHLSEAHDRSMRMCDLAATLQLTPSGTTRRLDGLVRSGWVVRNSSETDRRVMLASLTDAGWDKLHEALEPHVQSVRNHFVDLLTNDELKAVGSAFTKIATQLNSVR